MQRIIYRLKFYVLKLKNKLKNNNVRKLFIKLKVLLTKIIIKNINYQNYLKNKIFTNYNKKKLNKKINKR